MSCISILLIVQNISTVSSYVTKFIILLSWTSNSVPYHCLMSQGNLLILFFMIGAGIVIFS